MKKVCTLCFKEKNFDQFTKDKNLKGWMYSYCKECETSKVKDSVGEYTDRYTVYKNEVKKIQVQNSIWINSLVKKGELKPVHEYKCSLGKCRDMGEHYHHIKYDSRSLFDPISIIAPLCIQCHRYVHTRLKQGVDISDMITDRIVLEYKLPPVFL